MLASAYYIVILLATLLAFPAHVLADDAPNQVNCSNLDQIQSDANSGKPDAQYQLGWMRFLGKCIPQDRQAALTWQGLAAKQGYIKAESALGLFFQKEGNDGEALKWIRAAAEHGEPHGQSLLGWSYYNGRSLPRDYKEAAKWARRAAEKDDPAGESLLAWLYHEGRAMPKNDTEAARWARHAAEQGSPEGQALLGLEYYNGAGVPQNYADAAKWARLSAEQNNADGESLISWLYHKGKGVPKDDVEAVKWARQAAEQGNTGGQLFLASMYHTGEGGLAQNDIEADKWYILVNKSGKVKTQAEYKLESTMSDMDIAEAKRRATTWKLTTTQKN